MSCLSRAPLCPRITHPGLSGDKAKLKLSSRLLLGSIGRDDGNLLNFNSSNMLTQVLLDPRDLSPVFGKISWTKYESAKNRSKEERKRRAYTRIERTRTLKPQGDRRVHIPRNVLYHSLLSFCPSIPRDPGSCHELSSIRYAIFAAAVSILPAAPCSSVRLCATLRADS